MAVGVYDFTVEFSNKIDISWVIVNANWNMLKMYLAD